MARWQRRLKQSATAGMQATPSVGGAASAAVVVMVLVVAAAVAGQAAAAGGDLTDFIKTKQRATVALAAAAREALIGDRRCELLATCAPSSAAECTVAACGWSFGPDILTCTTRSPNPVNGCASPEGDAGGEGGGGCTGIKLAMGRSFVRVAEGTELSVTDGLVPLDVYAHICQLRALDPLFLRQANDTMPWAHVGTSLGVHRIYPGQRRFIDEDGKCDPFDPRLRPWYASAASGPLDVAVVVDRSAKMGTRRTPSGRSVMDAVLAAVHGLLGTLDWSSYVGVIRYNDEADVLLSRRVLEQAEADNVETLQQEVQGITPAGGVDVSNALGRAYDLLARSSADPTGASARCTRVLFWVTGTEDDCYARECGPSASGPCTCTSSILAAVRAKQAALAEAHKEPVNIIVLSFGGGNDALARQLTCGGAGTAAQGLFVPITDDGGNLISAMAPAYRWLSAARRGVPLLPESVFFSEKYLDNSGSGEMTTAAMPFYDDTGALLGVSGVDIPFSEIAARSNTPDDEILTLSGQGTCTPLRLTSCEQQALRAEAGVCAERLPHGSASCFQPPSTAVSPGRPDGPFVWLPFLDPATALSASAAAAECAALTPAGVGRLATARSAAEATALAGVLGEDPTWIGLSRPASDGVYAWNLDSDGNERSRLSYTSGWPRGVPPSTSAGNCVVGDRRGVVANWAAMDCGVKAVYVCELPLDSVQSGSGSSASRSALCGGGLHRIGGESGVDGGSPAGRINPPPDTCQARGPLPACEEPLSTRRLLPFCNLGSPGDQCEDRCCPGCTCTLQSARSEHDGEGGRGGGRDEGRDGGGGGLTGGEIAGIAVGAVVGLVVVGAVFAGAIWVALPWTTRCVNSGSGGGGSGCDGVEGAVGGTSVQRSSDGLMARTPADVDVWEEDVAAYVVAPGGGSERVEG